MQVRTSESSPRERIIRAKIYRVHIEFAPGGRRHPATISPRTNSASPPPPLRNTYAGCAPQPETAVSTTPKESARSCLPLPSIVVLHALGNNGLENRPPSANFATLLTAPGKAARRSSAESAAGPPRKCRPPLTIRVALFSINIHFKIKAHPPETQSQTRRKMKRNAVQCTSNPLCDLCLPFPGRGESRMPRKKANAISRRDASR